MTALSILHVFGLNITKPRLLVLSCFLEQNVPLNIAILLRSVTHLDRVTVYRILKTFTEKGILYVLPSNNDTIWYALQKQVNNGNPVQEAQVQLHFICNQCQVPVRIEKPLSTQWQLPEGFVSESSMIVVNGKCPSCACK